MNQNYTDISIVQDKSGSMAPLRNETIGGFNTFIADQKKLPGKCLVTLTQFDTQFNFRHKGVDIQSVEPLTEATYAPGGATALLDAIGKTILETGQRLAAMPEPERPGKVVVVIMTDGEENSSKEFDHARIMGMIKTQTDQWKWNFIFLGANQDAIRAGAAIGVQAANAMSYAATGAGTTGALRSMSANLCSYRTTGNTGDLNFREEQRKEQVKEGAHTDSLNKS